MEKFEVRNALDELKERLLLLLKKIKIEKIKEEVENLSQKTMVEGFWQSQETAKKVNKDLSEKTQIIEKIEKLTDDCNFLEELFQSQNSDKNPDYNIFSQEISKLKKDFQDFEIKINLSGEYDRLSAILEIHPGAGGVEAQDWAMMILRMYQMYSEKYFEGYKKIDIQQGDVAGIKSATIEIKGDYAYGYLKGESGVHRLVRISPFDANKRRHTSFASVLVMPKIDKECVVEIKDEDLKIDTYHSSGAGGQSVNTTMSAVRITHLPTKIVVACQNERSQIQNKEKAISLLKTKLVQLEIEKQLEEKNKLKGEQKEITWGSQIRSYIFQPYQLVKDHRTNFEQGNIEHVMDGEIDNFIKNYLNK